MPHFYKSDPTLLNEVNGLSPDAEKHDTIVIMQPAKLARDSFEIQILTVLISLQRMGIPISAYSRLQLNLVVGDIKFNNNLKKFTNKVIPAFWMQIVSIHRVELLKLRF